MDQLYDELTIPSVEEGVGQYLLFKCDGELYAIETKNVQEIVEFDAITRVPMTQPYVLGVTNIRGNIVAVVDLKLRYGFEATKIADRSSIVVVRMLYSQKETLVGLLIDEVYEVDYILDAQLKNVPPFGGKIAQQFMKRIGRYRDENLIVLDLERLLDIDEISKVEGA